MGLNVYFYSEEGRWPLLQVSAFLSLGWQCDVPAGKRQSKGPRKAGRQEGSAREAISQGGWGKNLMVAKPEVIQTLDTVGYS